MTQGPLASFVARDAAMLALLELARRAASRAGSILITGETGTGKSHLARCIHDAGRGADRPFVIIDCGNIPEGLAENELFGHEAGAFSGASGRRAGKFEAADGGSVLLDRVADLPPDVQAKLLRVVQERSFERVGGQATVRVDVTLMATAGEDLPDLVARRLFREDLYYRLHVVHFQIPALRDRLDDVEPLALHFLDRWQQRSGRHVALAPDAVELLRRQAWPGNVREMQNALERAVALAAGPELDAEALAAVMRTARRSPARAIAELADARLSLEDIERLYLERVLQLSGGIGEAASILGIHRKTLLDKRKRYGLP